VKREEIERAVEALFAISCAGEEERAEIVRALEARFERVALESERLDRTHSLVRLMLSAIPALSRVRHLALDGLRRQAEIEGDPDQWSHGTVATRLGITRASAATIAHGPRGKMPKG
jgi:hypothetical protein